MALLRWLLRLAEIQIVRRRVNILRNATLA
jgi:hypothetical protein